MSAEANINRLVELIEVNAAAMEVMADTLSVIARGCSDPQDEAIEALEEVATILLRAKNYTVDDILQA